MPERKSVIRSFESFIVEQKGGGLSARREKRDGNKEGLAGFEWLGNFEGQPLMCSN